jgi:hypothetical protein
MIVMVVVVVVVVVGTNTDVVAAGADGRRDGGEREAKGEMTSVSER